MSALDRLQAGLPDAIKILVVLAVIVWIAGPMDGLAALTWFVLAIVISRFLGLIWDAAATVVLAIFLAIALGGHRLGSRLR